MSKSIAAGPTGGKDKGLHEGSAESHRFSLKRPIGSAPKWAVPLSKVPDGKAREGSGLKRRMSI